jgi:hypothetical protein
VPAQKGTISISYGFLISYSKTIVEGKGWGTSKFLKPFAVPSYKVSATSKVPSAKVKTRHGYCFS